MTKTKKILCAVLAGVLVATAIFFAVFNAVTDSFDYSKNPGKYVTLDRGDYIGLSYTLDDSEIEKPDAASVLTEIASKLLSYRTKETGDSTKYIEYTDAEIGKFDQIAVNYVGHYDLKDEGGSVIGTVYFTDGKMMDLTSLQTFQVGVGAEKAALFADAMIGHKPIDTKYTNAKVKTGETDILVPEGSIAYITYSWTRYMYEYEYEKDGDGKDVLKKDTSGNYILKTDENGAPILSTKVDTVTSSTDKKLVTEKLRLDLAKVPDYFAPGFAEKIVGSKVGAANSFKLDFTVDGLKYEYRYSVTTKWVVDEFNPISVEYTYPEDSTEKDIYGNELKGKTVTFDVAISYFHDAPTLLSEMDLKSTDNSNTPKKESIVTHDDYLDLDNTDFWTEKGLLTETDWKAKAENAGKTHEDYNAYLAEQYEAYVKSTQDKTYERKRMYLAGDSIWSDILASVKVEFPNRALKVTFNELKDLYEYTYNEGSHKSATDTTVTVYYRDEYATFNQYMNAMYTEAVKDGDAKAGIDWKTYLYCEAGEMVKTRLIIYYLYHTLGDDVKYTDDEFISQYYNNYIYFYYSFGTALPTSAVREGLMFDKVMEYLYGQTTVTWATETSD